MTPRQSEILKFVNSFWEKNDYSPSLEEIASGVNISSVASVYHCCNNLERRGYITRLKHARRSIELTDKGRINAKDGFRNTG